LIHCVDIKTPEKQTGVLGDFRALWSGNQLFRKNHVGNGTQKEELALPSGGFFPRGLVERRRGITNYIPIPREEKTAKREPRTIVLWVFIGGTSSGVNQCRSTARSGAIASRKALSDLIKKTVL